MPLKRSALYGAIRKRVADLKPLDAWQDEDLHFFVFQLKPVDEAADPAHAPVAVFTMHPEINEPVTGVVVTPKAEGEEAEIMDLRNPESVYTAPVNEPATGSDASPPDSPAPVVVDRSDIVIAPPEPHDRMLTLVATSYKDDQIATLNGKRLTAQPLLDAVLMTAPVSRPGIPVKATKPNRNGHNKHKR